MDSQTTWERDIAIKQLEELGFSFGEKVSYKAIRYNTLWFCPRCREKGSVVVVQPFMKHCCYCGCNLTYNKET